MTDSFMENDVFNLREASPKGSATGENKLIPVKDPKDVWKDSAQPWASSMGGRLAIRAVSRGIMGAAFYAWGGQKATADMKGYDADNPQGLVQHIARFFDTAAGKPIEKLFGEKSVQFRPTLTDREKPRSLGEDVVDNTFNFAMATVGDALGRNIVGLFDPNAESKWRGDDGKVNFPKAVKSTVFAAGRIFEAQMEDWFVAVPYTYQKRFQRRVIDKISPGYAWDADRALNGSSFKVDDNGNVVGSFAFEGALDLQGRFTGYNIGTMMFRDGMKSLKSKLHERFDPEDQDLELDVPVTPKSVITGAVDAAKNAVRYTIKSVVKATLIMTPSVPAFWTFRVGQGKYKSVLLDKDGRALGTPTGDGKDENIRMHYTNRDTAVAYHRDEHGKIDLSRPVPNPFADPNFDPYAARFGVTDAMLNPFGKAARTATVHAQEVTDKIAERYGMDAAHLRDFADRYVNGTMAYTPYIYTKNEFAHRWDTPKMDSAIYRAIDGMFGFNMGELKAGAREMREAMKNRGSDVCASHPETVPMQYDKSKGAFVRHQAPAENASSWRDRVSKPAEEQESSLER